MIYRQEVGRIEKTLEKGLVVGLGFQEGLKKQRMKVNERKEEVGTWE